MLNHIHIKDLAIVSSLELELKPGMTVLTGETGAGKSILIDALGLALGDRADNSMIRAGCDRAEITTAFDISTQPEITGWLEEQALASGPECIVRRVLVRDGRSRAFINDSPVSLQSLQELGERLVDIHGQHAHQSLLHRRCQRELLDAYAGHDTLVQETARLHREMNHTQEQLEQLKTAARDRTARLELLSYQVNELEQLRLTEDELKTLDEEHARLSNVGQLQASCAQALSLLYDTEGSVQEQLAKIINELETLSALDGHLSSCRELLDNALIQVEEATTELRQYGERLESNPSACSRLNGAWRRSTT